MSVMSKRVRPSWMPPPLAFPIVWSTIGVLRTVAAVMIWEAVGRCARWRAVHRRKWQMLRIGTVRVWVWWHG
jgi:tryptophan-rich sensory protein